MPISIHCDHIQNKMYSKFALPVGWHHWGIFASLGHLGRGVGVLDTDVSQTVSVLESTTEKCAVM